MRSALARLRYESETLNMRGTLLHNEPMSLHTSWRAGGKSKCVYVPADLEDLSNFMGNLPIDEPVYWAGLGSNLLVRDGGYEGTMILASGVLDDLIMTGSSITTGAGISCVKVAKESARKGLIGAEFLAGIPGTIGGALAMNAGAFGGETWDIVEDVTTIDRSGKLRKRIKSEFDIAYRSVSISDDEWFVSARLLLKSDEQALARSNIKDLLSERAEKQPLGEKSCGSVFRNPEGYYAARLIETSGLKGKKIGAARVSEKHANFIINEGKASASDIEALIKLVQSEVLRRHKVELQTEVRIIGRTV